MQIVVRSELIEAITGRPAALMQPQPAVWQPRLQAVAAQALVALARDWDARSAELNVIVRRAAGLLAQPLVMPPAAARGGLSPAARRRVHALIDGRLAADSCVPPSVGELAGAAGLSVNHFVTAFRESEGETPYARVNARRIDKALTLLLRAGARVDEVAYRTGFSSASHFVSAFRRHVGVTPGAVRDAARSHASAFGPA